ncbi:hypothetical protein AAEX28_00340 [Lentisphaerota bacterium WC36G]|nr:hypothetical protein LJT99_03220 [Lentisphaerae bacterium WC36]
MLTTQVHSAVYWVGEFACAVSMVKSRHGIKVVNSASCEIENGDLQSALQHVCDKINFSKSHFNILCGDMGNSIVFDLELPLISAKDIESMLDFEVVQRLPVSLEYIKRQWRVVKTFDDNGVKKQVVRVVVINLKDWNDNLEILSNLNFKADIITSIKLVIDPICENKDVAIYGLMDNFIWQANEHCKREVIAADATTFEFKERDFRQNIISQIENFPSCKNDFERNAFCCAIIASLYSFSPDCAKDKSIVAATPKDFRVKRNVKQKAFAALLTFLIIIAAIILSIPNEKKKVVKKTKIVSKELTALRKEVAKLQEENIKLKRLTTTLSSFDKGNKKSLQLTKVLLYLGKNLPRYCWVNNLRQNGGILDFSVTSYTNQDKILEDLAKVPKIDNKSLRKYAKKDDSVFVSMRAIWFDLTAGNAKGGANSAATRGFGGMNDSEKDDARKNKVDYSAWNSMEDVKNAFRDPVARNNLFLNMKDDPEYAKGVIDKVKSIDPKAGERMGKMYEKVKSGAFGGGRGKGH